MLFPVLSHVNRKPTWQWQVWWLVKFARYDVTCKPSIWIVLTVWLNRFIRIRRLMKFMKWIISGGGNHTLTMPFSTLNFNALWDWTWCNCVFHVRIDMGMLYQAERKYVHNLIRYDQNNGIHCKDALWCHIQDQSGIKFR